MRAPGWLFLGAGATVSLVQCSGASSEFAGHGGAHGAIIGDDSGAGDGGGSSSGGDDASGNGMATNPGEDAAIESGVDGANPAGSGGNGDAGVEGGSSGAALCQKLGSCCARIMMISPTSNVQSCVQAAQSGNASLCMSYYGLLTSTGLTALCP